MPRRAHAATYRKAPRPSKPTRLVNPEPTPPARSPRPPPPPQRPPPPGAPTPPPARSQLRRAVRPCGHGPNAPASRPPPGPLTLALQVADPLLSALSENAAFSDLALGRLGSGLPALDITQVLMSTGTELPPKTPSLPQEAPALPASSMTTRISLPRTLVV